MAYVAMNTVDEITKDFKMVIEMNGLHKDDKSVWNYFTYFDYILNTEFP